jgi:hypothetical protein
MISNVAQEMGIAEVGTVNKVFVTYRGKDDEIFLFKMECWCHVVIYAIHTTYLQDFGRQVVTSHAVQKQCLLP